MERTYVLELYFIVVMAVTIVNVALPITRRVADLNQELSSTEPNPTNALLKADCKPGGSDKCKQSETVTIPSPLQLVTMATVASSLKEGEDGVDTNCKSGNGEKCTKHADSTSEQRAGVTVTTGGAGKTRQPLPSMCGYCRLPDCSSSLAACSEFCAKHCT